MPLWMRHGPHAAWPHENDAALPHNTVADATMQLWALTDMLILDAALPREIDAALPHNLDVDVVLSRSQYLCPHIVDAAWPHKNDAALPPHSFDVDRARPC